MYKIRDKGIAKIVAAAKRARKTARSEYEPPNLDGMWPDDLERFAEEDNLRFGNRLGHPKLRDYALTKAKAMRARESGDIQRAVRLEDRCDAIYDHMPEHLKW